MCMFRDATSTYKVVSSAYEIILFSRLFHISAVYRIKSNELKTLPWYTAHQRPQIKNDWNFYQLKHTVDD